MKTFAPKFSLVASLLLAMSWFSVNSSQAQTNTLKLKVGEAAPLVTGVNQDGKEWRLANATGKKVVLLYFYPKDETPGCTKEACGMRDSLTDLQKSDVEVIGVSFDSAESHKSFIAKHGLNFP